MVERIGVLPFTLVIVYVQPHTQATSSTVVNGGTPTTLFTNAPVFDVAHPGGSGIFGGFKRNKTLAPSMQSAILPSSTGAKPWDSHSSITVRPVQRSDHGHKSRAAQPQPRTLEQWRET